MATIREKGPYQWQVQSRRKGWPYQNATFRTKKDAEAWARKSEHAMDRGLFVDQSLGRETTLRDLIESRPWERHRGQRRVQRLRPAGRSRSRNHDPAPQAHTGAGRGAGYAVLTTLYLQMRFCFHRAGGSLLHQFGLSGNNPGIHREASVAGKARRSGARVLSEVTTP